MMSITSTSPMNEPLLSQVPLDTRATEVLEPQAPLPSLKRMRNSVSPQSTILPLTRANLKLLDSMTSNHVPTTRSRPRGASSTNRTTTSARARQNDTEDDRLLQENLIFEDEIALQDRPSLYQFVIDIIGSGRHSEASQKSIQRFKIARTLTAESSEAAFLLQVLPMIIKNDRSIDKNEDGSIILEDWHHTPLRVEADLQFRANCVPYVTVSEDQAIKRGHKSPKPDRIFGTKNKLGIWHVLELIRWHMEVCPKNVNNPFFLIEGYGDNGPANTARFQARRGAAAVVKAMEEIWRTIHDVKYAEPPFDTPQLRSAIFTMTINPEIALVFVNWCQHRQNADGSVTTEYYMTYVRSFALRDPDILVPTRILINNILDWGIGPRYNSFWNMVDEAEQMKKAEAVSVTSDTLSPSKKRKVE